MSCDQVNDDCLLAMSRRRSLRDAMRFLEIIQEANSPVSPQAMKDVMTYALLSGNIKTVYALFEMMPKMRIPRDSRHVSIVIEVGNRRCPCVAMLLCYCGAMVLCCGVAVLRCCGVAVLRCCGVAVLYVAKV
jgi:hypothetical protein